jgi:hypothetical protein
MFGTLLTPESTVTRTAFAATAGDEGADNAVVELLDPAEALEPPPPPPPHAVTSSASRAAPNSVTTVELRDEKRAEENEDR